MALFRRQGLTQAMIITTFFLIARGASNWNGNESPWNNGDSGWQSCPPWWSSNNCDDNNNGDGNGNVDDGGGHGAIDPSLFGLTASQVSLTNRIIIIHAVLACLVWVFLIPLGAILLRVGIRSPWILRLHAVFQIFNYLVYTAAAGLGIWLVTQLSYGPFSLWDDAHAKLGVAVLAMAFLQPVLGFVHHRMFKNQSQNAEMGHSKSRPGRTIPGHAHLWIGRILVVLGIVNGGLGLRLSWRSPFAGNQRSKIVAYSVCAALMFLIYIATVILFEIRKAKEDTDTRDESEDVSHEPMDDSETQLPAYDQIEESLRKEESAIRRSH